MGLQLSIDTIELKVDMAKSGPRAGPPNLLVQKMDPPCNVPIQKVPPEHFLGSMGPLFALKKFDKKWTQQLAQP